MKKVKMIIFSIIWVIYFIFIQIYQVPFTNEVALTQFDNSVASYSNFQFLLLFKKYGVFLLLLITILFYFKNIKEFIKNKKER